MNIDHLNLIIAVAACTLFCVEGDWHAAVWAGIAAISYIRIIEYRK